MMIATVDIGNSSITFGVFHPDGNLVFQSKFSSDSRKCEDEYAILIKNILTMYQVPIEKITGSIFASVVPPLSHTIAQCMEKLFYGKPLVVEPGMKTGLNIKIENPAQLGSDIVANTVAVLHKYPTPCILFDMGTATTVTIINIKGELCGELILPGVKLSAEALASKTAQLPDISLTMPKAILGKNTIDSMNSGILYGHACMVDGFIHKVKTLLQTEEITNIATGGHAEKILSLCDSKMYYEPNLILDGLFLLYQWNKKSQK